MERKSIRSVRSSIGGAAVKSGVNSQDSQSKVESEFLNEFWEELAGGDVETVDLVIVKEVLSELYNPGNREQKDSIMLLKSLFDVARDQRKERIMNEVTFINDKCENVDDEETQVLVLPEIQPRQVEQIVEQFLWLSQGRVARVWAKPTEKLSF